ncbi:MAG: holo-ACP synthase [Clostridia bacterium]|nr:holo-ACP synthase [Clostridia bacterium]MDD4665808.1 holo-ACP synthase [Clostridia bacterium]
MLYVGTDIVEIERIRKAAERHPAFWDRVLTPWEKEYCQGQGNPWQSLAGRFAAKEAVLKCLGLGLFRLSWHDVEIRADHLGCPVVNFKASLKKILAEKKITALSLSISHCRSYAMAVAVGEGGSGSDENNFGK